jgi:spore coat protein U-like protein
MIRRRSPAPVYAALAACLVPAQWNLLAACSVNSPTLNFGSYNPIAGSVATTNTTVTVSCSGLGLLISYRVTLDGGSSGSTANRTMKSGANALPYNVYTDAAYSTIWDNATGVTGSFLITLGTSSADITAYGRILASQPAPAGAYADSLVITLSY